MDLKAKESLNLYHTDFPIPFSNFKPFINRCIFNSRQTSWNNSVGNKLYDIKPNIGSSQSVVRNIRLEEVVLARIRKGHTRITYSYLLNREDQPQCVGRDKHFTVRHILLECVDFSNVRNKYYHVNTSTIKQLFNNVPIDNIFLFLKEIYLFNKL